jgi:hypothetical protein
MLCMNRDRLSLMEDESRHIARMLVDSIFHKHKRICNNSQPTPAAMEDAIAKVIMENDERVPLISGGPLTTVPGGVLTTATKPALKYMSQEHYTSSIHPLLVAQPPETLLEFKFTGTLQGTMPSPLTLFFLPQLVRLDLSFCQMDDLAFEVAGHTIGRRLPSLRVLNMARNRLEDSDLGGLVGGSLEELSLQHNPLSSRAASYLFSSMENNASLTSVDLSHTGITKHGLSLKGLSRWLASPARLVLPCCFETEELFEVMKYLPTGAELEMVGVYE